MKATTKSKNSIVKIFMSTRNQQYFKLMTLKQLQSKREHLRNKWKIFQNNYTKELKHVRDPAVNRERNSQFELVESQYIAALLSINERIMQLETEQNIEQSFEQEDNGNLNDEFEPANVPLDLPVNQVPVAAPAHQSIVVKVQNKQLENTWGDFDGSLIKWQGFHDRFCHAVHNDESMANSVKFQHLQRSLKGKALIAFGDWDGSNESYPEAWARMKELYNREFQISKELLWKFNNLPKLDYPSSGMLQKLSNVTHEVLRQLRALKYPVEHYDLFLVHPLHDKLDPETRKIYELSRDSERPKIQDMLNFLDQHAKALQGVQQIGNKLEKDNRKRTYNDYDKNSNSKRMKLESNESMNTNEKCDIPKCRVCNGAHPVIHCAKFKKIEKISERKAEATKHELCYNCLKPFHSARECFADGCKRCDGTKHNSLLCPRNPLNKLVNSANVKNGKSIRRRNQSKKQ